MFLVRIGYLEMVVNLFKFILKFKEIDEIFFKV